MAEVGRSPRVHLKQVRTLRVCHIITGLAVGGAERALHSLLSGGLANAHDCHVISLSDEGYYGALISELGVPVHCLGMTSGIGGVWNVTRLRSLLRDIRPDILQGWMYHGNFLASVGRLMLGGKPALVWNVRQSLYDMAAEKRSTQVVIKLSRRSSRDAAAILYNSRVSRGHHEALGFDSRNGRVIPNGFDLDVWCPDAEARASFRRSLGLTDAAPLLGYVGRFDGLKDVPNLLTALREVMAVHPTVHVAIVGRELGPTNPALGPLYSALPAERLHVLGQKANIPEIVAGLDLLCLCSRSEGFPNVVGEAMATGVPVVVTDVGDSADVVGDTGWIVPPSDSTALARAILDALAEGSSTRNLRGQRARQRIEERFSLKAAVAQYDQLYRELASRC
jgi:glycosyltransferase involved in cell wall biosynthesis